MVRNDFSTSSSFLVSVELAPLNPIAVSDDLLKALERAVRGLSNIQLFHRNLGGGLSSSYRLDGGVLKAQFDKNRPAGLKMSWTPPSMVSASFVEIDLKGRVSYGRALLQHECLSFTQLVSDAEHKEE
jgi:hypothetical protein